MQITASYLTALGVVDDIVPEPKGGAHTDPEAAVALLDAALLRYFEELRRLPVEDLLAFRYKKFRDMAQFFRVE